MNSFLEIKLLQRVYKNYFIFFSQDLFQLQPLNAQEDLLGDTVVLAGPGNVKKRTNRRSTSVQWQVCKPASVTIPEIFFLYFIYLLDEAVYFYELHCWQI
jgi:hypothetical protein